MAKSILLSGAQGFTGEHLTRAASEKGYSVHALQSNVCARDELQAEIEGRRFDYVVHLAAISAVTHDDELALYRVNVFGTLNLLAALSALETAPEKVILASSANIYGNTRASPISEATPPAPVNHYAMSKLAMEHMSVGYAQELPLVTTRPFNYTGVGHDDRFIVPKLVRHFAERRATIELGNIDVRREFNDVRSVCAAYLGLAKTGAPGEAYNICSGRVHSLVEVIDRLTELTGHRIDVRVNPKFVRQNEVQTLCGDAGKLQACVGDLEHPPLEETLRWMLSSYA